MADPALLGFLGIQSHPSFLQVDLNMDPAAVRWTSLGFSRLDCQEALRQAQHQLDDAALWLTQHAPPLQSRAPSAVATKQTSFFSGTS